MKHVWSFPFCRWGKGDTERFNNSLKVTASQWGSRDLSLSHLASKPIRIILLYLHQGCLCSITEKSTPRAVSDVGHAGAQQCV